MRDKFTFFASYFDAISDLESPEEKLAAYEAICKYALSGEAPKCSGVVAMMFKLVKPVLDKSAKRSAAGRAGGEAKGKQKESKKEAKDNRKESNRKAKCNDCASYKEKDKEKDKEKRSSSSCSTTTMFAIPTKDDVVEFLLECGYDKGLVEVMATGFVRFNSVDNWKNCRRHFSMWESAAISYCDREEARYDHG